MIHRPYDERAIYASFKGYAGWKAKAAQALLEAHETIQAGGKPIFDRAIYSRLKELQLEWFCQKCAYCESNITASSWGDVEHYRPKRGVTGEDGHPGYYWLAYEPSNLMPSCQRCNQSGGKKNHFPVQPGTRAFREDQIAAEQALLLNPYLDKPSEHLDYTFDATEGKPNGFVEALSEKGRVSIEIYGLNRHPLRDERKGAQRDAITSYQMAKLQKELDEFFETLAAARQSYFAARVAAIVKYIAWDNARSSSHSTRLRHLTP